MKKILLTTTALIALGIAPAAAADLAARPYTKAPAAAIAINNWSGFYAGVNGGWGSSRNRWDETSSASLVPMGSHDATGGTVGGQIWLPLAGCFWCSAWKPGQLGGLPRQQCDPACSGVSPTTRVSMPSALFTGQRRLRRRTTSCSTARAAAAVTSDRYRVLATGTGVQLANSVDAHPLGWRGRRWRRDMASPRTGRSGIEYLYRSFMQDKTY